MPTGSSPSYCERNRQAGKSFWTIATEPAEPNRLVIPTEAKRSGGTCGSLNQHLLLRETPHHPCHPDRSEAKWRDLRFSQPAHLLLRETPHHPCHPDRSEAKWRDLQFSQPASTAEE